MKRKYLSLLFSFCRRSDLHSGGSPDMVFFESLHGRVHSSICIVRCFQGCFYAVVSLAFVSVFVIQRCWYFRVAQTLKSFFICLFGETKKRDPRSPCTIVSWGRCVLSAVPHIDEEHWPFRCPSSSSASRHVLSCTIPP
jgi:hypothetical protein